MKRIVAGVLRITAALFLLVVPSLAGPFGFEYGMTKDQVIRLVGRAAVNKDDGVMVDLKTAPKPHELFESYTLYISPERGLLKILAISRDIPTSKYGDELKSRFEGIGEGLEKVYGKPTDRFDFVGAGSIWTESEDWMMGLLKKERTLSLVWMFKPPREHQTIVALEVKALSSETGYLSLVYEFEGWDQYVDERESKKADVF